MNREILINAGVDFDIGLERFSYRVESYEKYLKKFIDDETFNNLTVAMNNKDFECAFALAHTLRGSVGSLSINRLYNLICPFVEDLRNGKNTKKACDDFAKIIAEYNLTIKALKESL